LSSFEDAELHRHVAEVVDLDQVHGRDAEAAERFLDLCARRRRIGRPAAARRDIDLGGPEELLRDAEFAREPAGDFFGGAVGGRGVEHRGAARGHHVQYFAQRRDVLALRDCAKRGGTAEADDGDQFPARGNRPVLQAGLGGGQARAEAERGARAECPLQPLAPIHHGPGQFTR
jgi:hypothetical protein